MLALIRIKTNLVQSTSTTGSGAAPPPASTSSKGMAVHTQAPVVGPIAAVGFMGIVGILAAL